MQRAIRKYIKKESEDIFDKRIIPSRRLGQVLVADEVFGKIKSEIDEVKKLEIKRAKEKKLKEWQRGKNLNCRHGKKRLKGRSKRGRL